MTTPEPVEQAAEPPPAGRIRLARLAVANFRSHVAAELRLDGRHVCLYGPNGAGKTNLLEALSLLSPGRGVRGAELAEMANTAQREDSEIAWAVTVDFQDGGIDRRLAMVMERGDYGRSRRILRLDGAATSPTAVAELFRVIWLTPSMDRVFAGSAGDRRRFLDRMVLAHSPSHGSAAAAYEKAMRQRNALLEEMRPDPVWLDGLEQRMAESGAAMSANRAYAVRRMQAAIDERPEGYFPKADLSLEGLGETAAGQGEALPEIADRLARAFSLGRRRDAAAGRALDGPHRSDLAVRHRPKGLPAEQCSTGEQKALLMGLILANARALQGRDFAPDPLLLLDEAAAHLDSVRRAALYDELAALGGQAWLTGTDRSLFDAFGDRAQRFLLAEGQVRED